MADLEYVSTTKTTVTFHYSDGCTVKKRKKNMTKEETDQAVAWFLK